MSISKKDYLAIQKALRNRSQSFPSTKVWKALHEENGFGDISGGRITLTGDDYDNLRSWVINEIDVDPLSQDITGSRLDVAMKVPDEKWSSEAVFAGLIEVNMIAGAVPLKQGWAVTPPGTLLSINPDDLLLDEIESVILVENGIIARYWAENIIPVTLTSALMVYRGDKRRPKSLHTVRLWLRTLPAGVKKIGYFDFDPAGFGIAVDYEMDSILIPAPLDEQLIVPNNNKPELFDAQLAARPNLEAQLPDSLLDIWYWMINPKRRCAVTQEKLCVLNWALREVGLD